MKEPFTRLSLGLSLPEGNPTRVEYEASSEASGNLKRLLALISGSATVADLTGKQDKLIGHLDDLTQALKNLEHRSKTLEANGGSKADQIKFYGAAG